MEIKPKKNKMEVLMSDVTFVACMCIANMILNAVTLVLVVAVLVLR